MLITLLGYLFVLSLVCNIVLYSALIVAARNNESSDPIEDTDTDECEYLCQIFYKENSLLVYSAIQVATNPADVEIDCFMDADINAADMHLFYCKTWVNVDSLENYED